MVWSLLALLFFFTLREVVVRNAWYGDPAPPLPDQRLNINTEPMASFTVLPGIGPALAERIVQERETNGPFASIDDLLRVPGIGPRTLESVREYLFVDEQEE